MKRFVLLCLQGLATICVCNATQSSQGFYAAFDEEWSIGGESDKLDLIIGGPQHVVVDSSGKIFLADYPRADLQILDSSGGVLGSLGRRGNGPGEFQELTSLFIGSDDQVTVFDRLNRRASTFSSTGDLLNEYSLAEQGIAPSHVLSLGSGKLIMYYLNYSKYAQEGRGEVIHVHNGDLTYGGQSVGSLDDLWDTTVPLIKNTAGNPRGARLTSDSQDRVYLAPFIYTGSIHRYDFSKDVASYTRLEGSPGPVVSYSILEERPASSDPRNTRGVWALSGPAGRTVARINVSSRGIVTLSNGDVVHFTVRLSGDSSAASARLFVEIFNSSGTLSGWGPVLNYPSFSPDMRLYFSVLSVDKTDRIYIADESDGTPTLRAVRLKYGSD